MRKNHELLERLPGAHPAGPGSGGPEFQRELLNAFCAGLNELIDSGVEVVLSAGPEAERVLKENGLSFYTARITPWQKDELIAYLDERGMGALAGFLKEHAEIANRLVHSFSELQMMASVFRDGHEIEALEDVANNEGIEEFLSNVYERHLRNKYHRYSEDQKARNDAQGEQKELPAPVSLEVLRSNAPSFASYLGQLGQGELFYLDLMQPYELPEPLQTTYHNYYSALIGLGVAITAGVPSALAVALDWAAYFPDQVAHGVLFAFLNVAGSLLVGLLIAVGFRFFRSAWVGAIVGLAFGIEKGLDSGLSATSPGYTKGWDAGWHQGLITTVASVPIMAAMFWFMGEDPFNIVPIESWDPDTSKVAYWLLAALATGLLFSRMMGWYRGVAFGVTLGLFFFVRFGKKPKPAPIRIRPNQAILYSRNNAIWHAVGIGLAAGIATGISYGVAVSPKEGALSGLMALATLVVVFFFGGIPVTKHIALRLTLRRAHLIPPKLENWFQTAVGVGLLRQVGGGFGFTSEVARQHYAAMISKVLARLEWGKSRR